MKDRGSVILISGNRVALIKRVRDGMTFYVIPGGGIKEGESPEDATIREAYEELGITIAIKERVAIIEFNGGLQYYFLGEITGGTFGTGQGKEFTQPDRKRGTFEPVWMEIEDLADHDVRPREIADLLLTGSVK
ncbi:NUDIX hydrolase [Laceyella sacchari]|jgi:8-oxo-dGTP diphosphatase|uniref:NUDIX domain-containing protein n=1 Tax=Laceyella sacchari TaxID=37482 RepID=A0ABY5U4G3_LACSH|nr:NUDIX domain-containing protein [Laceyella sacchari]UWE04527.1 NUDIX domain-containing protein [Laceyella sacchari]